MQDRPDRGVLLGRDDAFEDDPVEQLRDPEHPGRAEPHGSAAHEPFELSGQVVVDPEREHPGPRGGADGDLGEAGLVGERSEIVGRERVEVRGHARELPVLLLALLRARAPPREASARLDRAPERPDDGPDLRFPARRRLGETDERAIRPERPACLGQQRDRIGNVMERSPGDDEVEAAGGVREPLGIAREQVHRSGRGRGVPPRPSQHLVGEVAPVDLRREGGPAGSERREPGPARQVQEPVDGRDRPQGGLELSAHLGAQPRTVLDREPLVVDGRFPIVDERVQLLGVHRGEPRSRAGTEVVRGPG